MRHCHHCDSGTVKHRVECSCHHQWTHKDSKTYHKLMTPPRLRADWSKHDGSKMLMPTERALSSSACMQPPLRLLTTQNYYSHLDQLLLRPQETGKRIQILAGICLEQRTCNKSQAASEAHGILPVPPRHTRVCYSIHG